MRLGLGVVIPSFALKLQYGIAAEILPYQIRWEVAVVQDLLTEEIHNFTIAQRRAYNGIEKHLIVYNDLGWPAFSLVAARHAFLIGKAVSFLTCSTLSVNQNCS